MEQDTRGVLLFLPYLPSIQWMTIAVRYELVYIEQQENFVKSTTRNRAHIATAQGQRALSIPIRGGRDHHQYYKDVAIDNSASWQKKHRHSLQAAYAGTPFYAHYIDALLPFYEQQYTSLFAFNLALLRTLLPLLKMDQTVRLTEVYDPLPQGLADKRCEAKFLPRAAQFIRYYQIFEARCSFLPNLCVLDLLFHLGPEAKNYLYELNESWK